MAQTALLITYYWPPGGGAGVHRWLRFSRFFQENDWALHVYSPQDAAWPITDQALLRQIPEEVVGIRRPIFEPHKYIAKKSGFNAGAGLGTQKEYTLLQRLLIWIRGNLFIPDARKFWIRPSGRFLLNYLDKHPEIDTIISTGPPHSMHVIARKLKRKKKQLTWVADFRDPWTEIDFYDELGIGKWGDRRQKQLEKSVLQEADLVVTVSDAWAQGLSAIGQRPVQVVSNGYIFENFDPSSISLDDAFSIAHFGSMAFARNPQVLWESLSELTRTHEELRKHLKIKLVGAVDYKVTDAIRKLNLQDYLEHIPSVSHAESIEMQRSAQLLLLVANQTNNVKGILTGKFFEYLGAKRPILAVGAAQSNLEAEVNATGCGKFVTYDDVASCKEYLLHCFAAYEKGNLSSTPTGIDKYDSGNLAKSYLKLITEHRSSNEL